MQTFAEERSDLRERHLRASAVGPMRENHLTKQARPSATCRGEAESEGRVAMVRRLQRRNRWWKETLSMRDMQDKAGLPAEGYIYGGWVTSTYGADGTHGSVELMVTPEAKDVQTADNSSHVPSGERVDGDLESVTCSCGL
jgi:hypothetical protein